MLNQRSCIAVAATANLYNSDSMGLCQKTMQAGLQLMLPPVLGIRIRRIRWFLGVQDPDPVP